MIRTNSIKAWWLAARPKTLTGAAAPVIVGGALAWQDVTPFVLCLTFALLMQIDANFVNDYFDFKKGTDREDRLGPERACAQGWITPQAMKWGISICTLLSVVVGIMIFMWNMQWELFAVGAACVVGCFLYTLCLSYIGLGDLLVLVFFGIVPVGFTYYVITNGEWTTEVTLAGIAVGLITDCLLLINNYRDIDQDRISGKRTIIVMFGRSFGRYAYISCALIAAAVAFFGVRSSAYSVAPFVIIMLMARKTYMEMYVLQGKELNKLLGQTARMIFVFALLLAIQIMFS